MSRLQEVTKESYLISIWVGRKREGEGRGGRKSVFTLLFIEPRMCSIFYESFFLLFPRDTLKEIERSFDLTKCVFGVLLFRVHTWNGGR